MIETLCSAIDALDSQQRGLTFHAADTPPVHQNFDDLGESVSELARKLNALGYPTGSRIILVFSDQASFVHSFLATIRSGLVAVPFHPPSLGEDLVKYHAELQRIRSITGARVILCDDKLQARLISLTDGSCYRSWSECQSLPAIGGLASPSSQDAALIQFTSGSTRAPRGVEISHGNLVNNARAIQQALNVNPARDRGLSWLPLHHDMGLIGFLITPILTQTSSDFLSPLDFARQPTRWPALMSDTRATISYSPNFGYHHVCRFLRQRNIDHWDLSAWRVAGCGGEPIIERVLRTFAESLSPCGFKPEAFVPSYGLAEATVAVTIAPLSRGILTRTPPPAGLGTSEPELPEPASVISTTNEPGQSIASRSIACGQTVAETELRIVDSLGNVVSGDAEGRVQVRGPSVARRFWQEEGRTTATDANGWLDTGDRGRLIDGELHISGRGSECLLINGRNYYPQDIEECACTVEGIRRGRIAALGRPGAGSEQLVLIVEASPAVATGDCARQLRQALRRRVSRHLGLGVADVRLVARSTITRTSSGKLQRRALRERYLAGDLDEHAILTQPADCSGVPPASGVGSRAWTRASSSLSC